MKEYTFHVTQTVRFWGHTKVVAESEEEACSEALHCFELDWENSETIDSEETLLEVSELPVSAEAPGRKTP